MAAKSTALDSSVFGKLESGEEVKKYTLRNPHGLEIDLLEFGGYLAAIRVPVQGGPRDVLIGYDDLQGFLNDETYMGCIVGRVANRVGGAQFTLDGQTYKLDKNRGEVHLHSGFSSMDKLLWKSCPEGNSIKFSCVSPDGASGYPGEVTAEVTYTLTEENGILIEYSATTSKKCPINLTNHAYFNLQGGADTVYNHSLTLNAGKYTALDHNLVPTGEFVPVAGTPYDFNSEKKIGEDIGAVEGGYDINYCLNDAPKHSKLEKLHFCAEAKVSDITMTLFTDQIGVQFYSGNFLKGPTKGKKGLPFFKHQGFCLETQAYPDSVNRPEFPNTVVSPGETYKHSTLIQFKF